MSAQFEIQKGSTAYIPLSTFNASGALTDADSTPAVDSVTVNGSGVATTGFSVAQAQDDTPANITGQYHVTFATGSYSANDLINIYASAVIGGITVNTVKSIKITDTAAGRPSIS